MRQRLLRAARGAARDGREALDAAARHVRQTRRAGRSLATYQALAHRLAWLWIEQARAEAALRQARTSRAEATAIAAAILCLDAARACACAELHVMGARAFLWEAAPERRQRRLDVLEATLGGVAALRARLGRRTFIRPGVIFD